MAELIGTDAGDSGGYQLEAGSYVKLLEKECDFQHVRDARLYPLEGGPDALAEWERQKAASEVVATEMFDELLAAGEPIVVSSTYHRGAPEWLSRPPIYRWCQHDSGLPGRRVRTSRVLRRHTAQRDL